MTLPASTSPRALPGVSKVNCRVPAGGRQQLLRRAGIGHVLAFDAGALEQQLGHQMAAGADAGRAPVELPGPRLGVVDEFLERLHAEAPD